MSADGNGTPEGLLPKYRTDTPWKPIPLYEGPVELCASASTTVKSFVQHVWIPRPRAVIEIEGYADIESVGKYQQVRIPSRSKTTQVLWTSCTASSGNDKTKSRQKGIIVDPELKTLPDAQNFRFHLINFPEYYGSPVNTPFGAASDRAIFETLQYLITIDRSPFFLYDKRTTSQPDGEFHITHYGQVVRKDGGLIEGKEVSSLYRNLTYFLSFCRGAWTSPVLMTAHNSDDSVVWETWSSGRVDARSGVGTWFPTQKPVGLGAFASFSQLMESELWEEPLSMAIHWYVISNTSRDNMEGAIILQQAAFELLAWTLLVEDREVLSEDAMKMPAADRLRLLFHTCTIPLTIPSQLTKTIGLAKSRNWKDSPEAITQVRNALVHPSPKKREMLGGIDADCRFEVWQLGQWYLELVLLKLLKYNDQYASRLFRVGYRGSDIQSVPWASTT